MPGEFGATAICLARVNISTVPMTEARDVSFTRVMTSFVTLGSTRFTICGRMMRKNVCPFR